MTGGAPPGTQGIVDLLGPTGLEIVAHAGRGVRASSLGGRQFLGRVALDDGETAITGRGRIRVGAPDGGSFLSQGGGAPNSSPTIVAGAQPSMPNVPSGTYVDGTFNGAPMAGALTSAMQMSSEVAARTNMPGRPGAGDQTPADSAALGAQASSALADMLSASSRVASSSSTPSFITGLQPGMWSGHRRSATSNYQSWTYSSGHDDGKRSVGGVDLSSLSRPVYPSLPTSLRFRYIGAPLWWSSSTRLGGDDAGSPAGGAMRAGLRAATSAASIWRSILMSSPQWTSSAGDLSGGMDSGHEASAREMSSLSRRFESLASASLVGAGGAHGASASGAAYVAVDGSGAAGTMTRAAAARARAASIEMSIVAAIPPAPPPLESMGSGMSGGNAAHARGKGGQQNQHKEASDAVSHSKIEGSVDAIAQRIYHRIRRRIQSDRERFGG
jgi:hypothetical protein